MMVDKIKRVPWPQALIKDACGWRNKKRKNCIYIIIFYFSWLLWFFLSCSKKNRAKQIVGTQDAM
ncbi:MAG: hypothetical protein CSA22_09670 [Deltaproteobacteria bacterium]|nr:MAG: hypothetical protein CSA22_09670 [Deltaproteobacteria bacterium]